MYFRPAKSGLQIGGYELVRRIGRGGMAEVWLARRENRGRPGKFVAIKLIADSLSGKDRYIRMFRKEVELSTQLSHANIVHTFDEGEQDGRAYLVMEWVDGLSLGKLSRAIGKTEPDTRLQLIAYITAQLLHALSYAHNLTSDEGSALGIVHRDVSPGNVLISNTGDVKLTDFGVAHFEGGHSSGMHVKGKLRYMAPEHISGQTRDPRSDLFGVGAILHELLDGKPFRHDSDVERGLHRAVLRGDIPSLQREVPDELDAVRLALLAPDPAQRIGSATAALKLLRRFRYGDMRSQLASLCAKATGVTAPRTSPPANETVDTDSEVRSDSERDTLIARPARRPMAAGNADGSTPRQRTVPDEQDRLETASIGNATATTATAIRLPPHGPSSSPAATRAADNQAQTPSQLRRILLAVALSGATTIGLIPNWYDASSPRSQTRAVDLNDESSALLRVHTSTDVEVKLGSRIIPSGTNTVIRLEARSYQLHWRRHGTLQWSTAQELRLVAGSLWDVRASAGGVELVDSGLGKF